MSTLDDHPSESKSDLVHVQGEQEPIVGERAVIVEHHEALLGHDPDDALRHAAEPHPLVQLTIVGLGVA